MYHQPVKCAEAETLPQRDSFNSSFLPETAPVVSPSTVFALGRLLLTVLEHELILLCANATQDEGLQGCFCACQSVAV